MMRSWKLLSRYWSNNNKSRFDTFKTAFVLRGPLLSFSKLRTPLLDYCPRYALVFSIFVGKAVLGLCCRAVGLENDKSGAFLSLSKLRTPLLDYCPPCALVFSIFVGKSRLWALLPCRRFGKREKRAFVLRGPLLSLFQTEDTAAWLLPPLRFGF